MAVSVRRLHPHFVAEVSGVDLRDCNDAAFAAVRAALEEHSVLVFHDQRWTDDEQIVFTRRFGPLEETVRSIAQNQRVAPQIDRKSTRLNSSHIQKSRMPSSA